MGTIRGRRAVPAGQADRRWRATPLLRRSVLSVSSGDVAAEFSGADLSTAEHVGHRFDTGQSGRDSRPLRPLLSAHPARNSISTSASPLFFSTARISVTSMPAAIVQGQIVEVQADPGETGRRGCFAPLDERVPGRVDETRARQREEARDGGLDRRSLHRMS